jgi:hypothetical protein
MYYWESASDCHSGTQDEAAQIAALKKSKQEQRTRWQVEETTFSSVFLGLRNRISQLVQDIDDLDSITAAEAADEAWKNSWGAWLLSFVYEHREHTDGENTRKDRDRQWRNNKKAIREARALLQGSLAR